MTNRIKLIKNTIRVCTILLNNRLRLKFDTLGLSKRGRFICDINKIKPYQRLVVFSSAGGKYEIGHNVQFGYDIGGRYKGGYCELQCRDKEAEIIIGNSTAINNNFLAISRNRIEIGNNCRIGINCQIMDFEAHSNDPNSRSTPGQIGVVIIEDNVWIGNNVIILKNVTIGKNSIIAAGAVVCHNVPPDTIVGGVPAKVIRNIDEREKNHDNA